MNSKPDWLPSRDAEITNAYLSAIIKSSNDAIISKDLDSIITSWNESAKRLFGYTAEEAIGQPVTMLFPEDRIDEEDKIISRIRRGERVDTFETKRKRKDGTLIDISLTVSPIEDSEGNIIGASKIARDITERKKAEAELKALNETLEQRVEERTQSLQELASKLNKAEENERQRIASELHDNLGQMLTVAKIKVDGLQHQPLADTVTKDVEELHQVIHDALSYNRNLMEELNPPPLTEEESVDKIVNWTVKKIEEKGLEVTIKEDGKHKPVNRDIRYILYQSVRELLHNVIKHADTNEALVSITRENDRVKVTVEDKGKGFDVNKETMTPTEEGGFGLFNIKERVNWHGGKFEIHSELGKGTTVIIYAPLSES